MTFDFSFLTSIFAGFYDFFMRIATLLTFSGNYILTEWSLGDKIFSWSFDNPFTGFSTTTNIAHSLAGEGFFNLLNNLGYGNVPLWVAFLSLTATFFLVTLVARVIIGIFD